MLSRRQFLGTLAAPIVAPVVFSALQNIAKAKPLNVKITGIKTFVVNAGSVTSKELTLTAAIMEHERLLIGKNAADIEWLWQTMFRMPRWCGGPILISAISAVEIALWDIVGQALGVPIYQLLGGAARKRIRMYLDIGGRPEDFLKAKELGYTAAKTTFTAVQ